MDKHLHNLSYLSRHKYYVFLAGLKTRVPIWRLIIHDWSKLLPSEWFPYADYFFGEQKRARKIAYYHQPGDKLAVRFDTAWLKHLHRNPHHWQHWILRCDEDGIKFLDMPETYIREMVADWMGAGRVQTGKWGVNEWYAKNRDSIQISDNTRTRVEEILAQSTTTS